MENKVTCSEIMNKICENLGEDQNSPKCVEIKKHMEECETCGKYFKSIDTTVKFYKEYSVDLSKEAHDNLISYLGLKE